MANSMRPPHLPWNAASPPIRRLPPSMADTGHKQSALEAWQKVLAIYPMMRSAQNQVSALSEELAGEGI